jgi:hypothetical protein
VESNLYKKTILPNLRKSVETHFGRDNGALIYGEACKQLTEFLRTANFRKNRAVELHMRLIILPGLSYYRSLLGFDIPKEDAIRYVSAELTLAAEKQKQRYLSLRGIPFLYPLFRLAARFIMSAGFPPAGWDTTWMKADREEISFTITKCVYCDVLKEYGAFELTPIFCEADDIKFKGLEPYILFKRTETLARGGKQCDFRFINSHSHKLIE